MYTPSMQREKSLLKQAIWFAQLRYQMLSKEKKLQLLNLITPPSRNSDSSISSMIISKDQTNKKANGQGNQIEALFQKHQTQILRTLKIDLILFSLQKSKKQAPLVNLLKEKYVRKPELQLISNLDNSHTIQQNQLKKQSLTLQLIDLVHYHSVIQTDQQKFLLRKSDYKKNIGLSSPLFISDYLWKIKFPQLKLLDLSSCKIATVQALSFIDMPQVKRLELHDNKIYNLNSLNKCQFKNIQYLSCYDNPIIEFSLASRGNFPNLNRIIADSDRIQNDLKRQTHKNRADQNSLYHLSIVFKLQNLLKMIEFKMNTRKRILPQRLKRVLRTINPKMKLKNKLTNEDLMNRLERLGGIGTRNDPQAFRRFLNTDVAPVLRQRQRNPNHIQAINQIRLGLWQKLRQLEQENQRRIIQVANDQIQQTRINSNPKIEQEQKQADMKQTKNEKQPVSARSSSGQGMQDNRGQVMDIEGQNVRNSQNQENQVLSDENQRVEQIKQQRQRPVQIDQKLQKLEAMKNMLGRNYQNPRYQMQEENELGTN